MKCRWRYLLAGKKVCAFACVTRDLAHTSAAKVNRSSPLRWLVGLGIARTRYVELYQVVFYARLNFILINM